MAMHGEEHHVMVMVVAGVLDKFVFLSFLIQFTVCLSVIIMILLGGVAKQASINDLLSSLVFTSFLMPQLLLSLVVLLHLLSQVVILLLLFYLVEEVEYLSSFSSRHFVRKTFMMTQKE